MRIVRSSTQYTDILFPLQRQVTASLNYVAVVFATATEPAAVRPPQMSNRETRENLTHCWVFLHSFNHIFQFKLTPETKTVELSVVKIDDCLEAKNLVAPLCELLLMLAVVNN